MKKHILSGQVGYISSDPGLGETKIVVVKEAISRQSVRQSNRCPVGNYSKGNGDNLPQ